ncbi:DUF4231 domain-containing protein [Blastococcus sp. PRF04-17]|uniref:DUF4231 domain-containing protein n=1 Tax=Blastococcus sp. PRF04-17 TaxID=2933797 RepID=UPI001FF1F704|nr:DUF4231 domain-containing protein [Blastococcus sp. PRF04-17]UOY00189.1 DUF4231 domain-containing protein [Blastococcus sp. PRF04-17]
MDRPALLARFPRPFWWRPDPATAWPDDWPVVPPDAEAQYPQLAPDLRLWVDEFEQPFRLLDHEAQLLQQRFWRQRTTLILGGLVATTLGAFQAAQGGGNEYLAGGQALVTGLLTGVAALVSSSRAQQRYLDARLKAERIKSEFFLYLGRVGPYAEPHGAQRLRYAVEDIVDAEEAR